MGDDETIQKARGRLADAELEDSEKDQVKHQSTIDSRGEKKGKQEKSSTFCDNNTIWFNFSLYFGD